MHKSDKTLRWEGGVSEEPLSMLDDKVGAASVETL